MTKGLSRSVMAGSLALALMLGTAAVSGAQAKVGPSSWNRFGLTNSHNVVWGQGTGVSFLDKSLGIVIDGVTVSGNTAYVGTLEGNVDAVNATTGSLIWSTKMPNAVFGPAVVAQGVVYIGIGNDTMQEMTAKRWVRGTGPSGWYALSAATGAVLWKHPTVGTAKAGLVYQNGVLYTVGGGGHLRALDAKTGKTIWKVFDGGVDNAAAPVLYHGMVIVPTGGPGDTALRAFSMSTGHRIWSYYGDNADNSPAEANGTLYITNVLAFTSNGKRYAQDIYKAINAKTGKLIWRQPNESGPFPPAYAAPAVTYSNGVVYATSSNTPYLNALSATTGKLLWQTKLHAPSYTMPTVVNGYVLVGDLGGYLDVVNAKTGSIAKALNLGGAFGAGSVSAISGTAYVANFKGNPLALADPGVAPMSEAGTGNLYAIKLSTLLP